MYLSLMCSSQTWCKAAVWDGLGVESLRLHESQGLCCSLGPGLYLLEASPRSCSPHSSSKLWFGVGGCSCREMHHGVLPPGVSTQHVRHPGAIDLHTDKVHCGPTQPCWADADSEL